MEESDETVTPVLVCWVFGWLATGKDGISVGVEDSSLVRKRKCCLVKAVVGQGDRQQQYYS